MNFFRTPSVGCVSLPRRRLTGWAVVYFLVFLGAPILGPALILDIFFSLVLTEIFDSCYGVPCRLT
jgi:hypothetical protein